MIERGRREQSRLRLRLPCRLITRDGDAKVILTDLSQTGARVQTAANLAAKGEAVLLWFGMEAFGSVVWTRTGLCGFRFFDPIPHNWLIVSRDLDETNAVRDEREVARQIAREWVAGVRRI
ncbi:MAG: PilZ domain-containing protein [Sphingomonadales bacterium]|nr:PilZ domain-containing protein [Sphingomonadales bacterium]